MAIRALILAAAISASPASAALVRIDFTGTNSSPNASNVFGVAVPTVSGYLVYDSDTAGSPFVVNASRSAFNYAGAITEFMFDLGSGIGGAKSGTFGSVQVSDQFTFGNDRLSFNSILLNTSEATGEPALATGYQITIGLSGPFGALSSSALPGVFDPSIFSGQKNLELFVQRPAGSPAAGAVRFNFNFDTLRVTSAEVPEPAALGLFGLGLAAVALRRRMR